MVCHIMKKSTLALTFKLLFLSSPQDSQDSFILEDHTGQCKVIKSDTLASGLKTPVNSEKLISVLYFDFRLMITILTNYFAT